MGKPVYGNRGDATAQIPFQDKAIFVRIEPMRALLAVFGILLLVCLAAVPQTAQADIALFHDDFNSFNLGTNWQGTTWQGATGVPTGLTGNVSYNSATALQMYLAAGSTGWKGLETVNTFPIGDKLSVKLDVRTTAANVDSASPMEVTLKGSSDEWAKWFYTYTAWTNNYLDSDGHTGSFGQWPSNMQPSEYRRWVLEVDQSGVTATLLDKFDVQRWSNHYPSPTLQDLGTNVSILLRQAGHSTNVIYTYVDYVDLTATVPEPSTLLLLVAGGLSWLVFTRSRRSYSSEQRPPMACS